MASVVQEAGQPVSVPSHTNGAHGGEPVDPEGSVTHVPLLPHASQAPAQAALQQTLSAQKPERHWSVAEQVAPRAPCGTHWWDESQ